MPPSFGAGLGVAAPWPSKLSKPFHWYGPDLEWDSLCIDIHLDLRFQVFELLNDLCIIQGA